MKAHTRRICVVSRCCAAMRVGWRTAAAHFLVRVAEVQEVNQNYLASHRVFIVTHMT